MRCQDRLALTALLFTSFNSEINGFMPALVAPLENSGAAAATKKKTLTSTRLFVSSQDDITSAVSSTTATGASESLLSLDVANARVDMNQYNLDPKLIPEQWTAKLQAATEMQEAGAYLIPKDATRNFADTVKVIVAYPGPGQGLGIELLELAGGRADGLGITIVSGLVPGKCAENSGLLFGDAITQVSLRQKNPKDGGSIQEISAASTECLAYDGTIDAILSMLERAESESADSQGDLIMVFTVKRLRRKPVVKMTLQYPPDMKEPDLSLELFAGENLRRAMLVRGVKLNDPLARRFDNGGSGDCGAEGTCATCAVSVVQGLDLLNPPKETERQMLQRSHARWRMACKTTVGYGMKEGELVLRVHPRQWVE